MGFNRSVVPPILVRGAVLAACALLVACGAGRDAARPGVVFVDVPRAAEGGPLKVDTISGRVSGARPGQRIVLFARSGAWYVQPFVVAPYTEIQPDATWSNATHLGTEYAALLVEPGYEPPVMIVALPEAGDGVVAVAVTSGEPMFWNTWWFRVSCVLGLALGALAWYRARMRQLTRQLNLRFEERLAERTRIAQDLHDTLLQGVVSASMQLHVALDLLPADSSARPLVGRVVELMGDVVEEGRNAVSGLRSPGEGGSLDLEQAFTRIRRELAVADDAGFRVIVEGRPRPLHPVIRDEVYAIGREALVNAFRHSGAKTVEVEVEFTARHLRLLVRDDGCGIDSEVLRGGRDGHWGLSGMRERAERVGARLKVWSRRAAGTEVELTVPGQTAFADRRRRGVGAWLARVRPRPDHGKARRPPRAEAS